ncbi:MAG: GNAT family N-acetyltransferase [Acholeplasmataceae bacterium]|jgi:predicted GNAT family acetyltransferase|nr:GNAT family N-acetyltransferase [Acholeplasmataceae bacterium]MDD4194651.1 GNAT family N-acetyltransferase [Acholeplasmataceae bacterium]MDY0339218.1 GNAT family N-acetyltransferase [Acholeplasmataceae bacterium]
MNFIYEPHRIYVNNEEGKMIVNATFPWLKPGVVVVDHTFVDPSLRGQGIASQLMFEVVNYSKKQGYKVTATCPYAVTWFKKHPEASDVLDELEQAKLAPECQI